MKNRKKQLEQQRKSEEKSDDAAAEEDLEKDKKKGGPNVGKLVPKQVKSLWAKLLDFFTGIILGWVAVRMVDFLPVCCNIFISLGPARFLGFCFQCRFIRTVDASWVEAS